MQFGAADKLCASVLIFIRTWLYFKLVRISSIMPREKEECTQDSAVCITFYYMAGGRGTRTRPARPVARCLIESNVWLHSVADVWNGEPTAGCGGSVEHGHSDRGTTGDYNIYELNPDIDLM